MNALMFLYTRSIKNRLLGELKSPRTLAKALIMLAGFALFMIGIFTGVITYEAPMETSLLRGMTFALFLLPYLAGRFGGIGAFRLADVVFVFTAPILPRTVLLNGLLRRINGVFMISFAIIFIFAFSSTLAAIGLSHILWIGLFCILLTVVCMLFGMFLFVAYRNFFRWMA